MKALQNVTWVGSWARREDCGTLFAILILDETFPGAAIV